MKTFKKIFAAILCIALLIVSTFATSAAIDSSEVIKFTVNCTKPGYTFTVYKVADLVSTTASPYETRYDSLIPEIADEILTGDTAALLAALDGVQTMPTTVETVGTYDSDDSATATFTNLDMGIYYIKATNYPAGVKSVRNSVVSLPYYDGADWQYTISNIELATKVVDGSVTTEKTITNSTKNNVNFTDVSLGDTVEFEIRSTTAGSSSMKLGSYAVYDDMSAGLTLDKNSFNVALLKADGSKITDLDKSEYTMTVTSEGEGKNTTFDVALTKAYLQTEEFYGTDVYYTSVTYSATLNKYAVVDPAVGNPNTDVKVEYSNKNGVSSEVEGNTVYVYTYAAKVNKTDKATNLPLADANFSLFATKEDAEALENVIATGTSDANGTVLFYNTNNEEMRLTSGKWFAVETSAPEGYMVYSGVIEIDLTAGYGATFVDGTWVTSCPVDGYGIAGVTNSPVVFLETGGVGTVIFSVVGGIGIIVASVFFVIYFAKRRKATETN